MGLLLDWLVYFWIYNITLTSSELGWKIGGSFLALGSLSSGVGVACGPCIEYGYGCCFSWFSSWRQRRRDNQLRRENIRTEDKIISR